MPRMAAYGGANRAIQSVHDFAGLVHAFTGEVHGK